MAQKVLKGK